MDSHIIPRALTRLSKTGEKSIEAGIGLGFKRRPDSWYDGKLVTRKGEDILSDIDSKAIKELRKHRLIWSGWAGDEKLRDDEVISVDEYPKHRLISFDNPNVLGVYFLSLLWRAAASNRPEFAEIKLNEAVLEDLRNRVLHQNVGDPEDYPIQLFQIVTRGAPHNRTPLLEQKPANPEIQDGEQVSYVRFYFDGLICHIHLNHDRRLDPIYLKTCLGFTDALMVFAYDYDESRAERDVKEVMRAVAREHPNAIK